MTSTRSWTRLDGVDLLRGLAILFVLMNHVNMRLLSARVPYTRGLPHQLVSTLVWNGQYGVQIFFAVSGFLITSTALRRWGGLAHVDIRDFYRLRLARIAPLLLLLLAVLSTLHLARVPDFIVSQKTGGLPRALLAALTFHINLLEARRGYLPPAWDILWSLSIEEVFYLFFPLACRVLRSARGPFNNTRGSFDNARFFPALLFVFVILGPIARSSAFHYNEVWHEYSYLGGMDAIALGCLTAILLQHRLLSRTALRTLAVAGTACLVFILGFSIRVWKLGLARNGLDMTLLALGTCMLIAASAASQARRQADGKPLWQAPRILTPLLLMGRRSYEIYLTHIFAVLAFFSWFLAAGKPMRFVPALFLAVIVSAAILGTLVARFYTEPLNHTLRNRWNEGKLGSVLTTPSTIPSK